MNNRTIQERVAEARDIVTRDPRTKERKKPGLRRARKAKQYTKR